MGMFMKTLRMTVSVFSLILASAVPSSAQANVFVNGNTTFTVTWQGVKEGATLLATATFTVSNFSGTSFVMTVTNVSEHDADKPQHQRTAYGVRIRPDAGGHIQQSGPWKHLPMGVHEFPGVSTRRCVFDER